MTAASPTSATVHPTTHIAVTRLRSTSVPKRLVKTGSVARMRAPCVAEVRACPTVNSSGKAMNAAKPENARVRPSRRVVGSGWRNSSTSGRASAPANTVLRMPTINGSICPTAILENSGVPPHTSIVLRATTTGSAEWSGAAAESRLLGV